MRLGVSGDAVMRYSSPGPSAKSNQMPTLSVDPSCYFCVSLQKTGNVLVFNVFIDQQDYQGYRAADKTGSLPIPFLLDLCYCHRRLGTLLFGSETCEPELVQHDFHHLRSVPVLTTCIEAGPADTVAFNTSPHCETMGRV